ncbi:MAG: GerW family sporulation protein [Clostridia bacterium]|nr:GerW family sporulation protein [Clostridia bacterium]
MEHPIGKLMQTTLENIKDMVDVNTVIGEPIAAPAGVTVIPFSKVSFGFATGGGDYDGKKEDSLARENLPFAGGSGAGVSVQPVGFLVITMDGVRLLPAQNKTALERAMGCAPQLMEDIRSLLESHKEKGDQRT